jgi:hypothetical protein
VKFSLTVLSKLESILSGALIFFQTKIIIFMLLLLRSSIHITVRAAILLSGVKWYIKSDKLIIGEMELAGY